MVNGLFGLNVQQVVLVVQAPEPGSVSVWKGTGSAMVPARNR